MLVYWLDRRGKRIGTMVVEPPNPMTVVDRLRKKKKSAVEGASV